MRNKIVGAIAGVTVAFTILLLGVVTFTADAATPFFESYENGGEVTHYCCSHSFTRTNEAARHGNYSAQYLLRPGDPRLVGPTGTRVESGWQGSEARAGDVRTYEFSYYFPRDWNQGRNSTFNDRIITQFTDSGSPMWSFHILDNQLKVRQKVWSGSNFRYHYQGPLPIEQWVDLKFNVKWSKGSDGWMRIYMDGNLIVNYSGRTLSERNSTYAKWGIYGQPTRLLIDRVAWDGAGPALPTPTPTPTPTATPTATPTQAPDGDVCEVLVSINGERAEYRRVDCSLILG